MARCLLAFGSNQGDRETAIEAAVQGLVDAGARLVARSRNHLTSPVGGPAGQPEFLNAAAVFDTDHRPQRLLALAADIEQRLGRVRSQRWAARTIDIDLLLYEDQVVDEPGLHLPHPRLAVRRFVLAPAAEIAPTWPHPQIGWTLRELLAHVNEAANYAAICETPAGDAVPFCRAVEQHCVCRALHLDLASRSDHQDRYSQRLAKAATILQQTVLPSAHEQWLVSDFWLCDSLALAAADEAARSTKLDIEALADKTRLKSLRPKLLIVIDSEQEGGYRQALARVLRDHYQGPLLRVAANQSESITDVVTAMQGMTAREAADF